VVPANVHQSARRRNAIAIRYSNSSNSSNIVPLGASTVA
jgi:hypothetical protein